MIFVKVRKPWSIGIASEGLIRTARRQKIKPDRKGGEGLKISRAFWLWSLARSVMAAKPLNSYLGWESSLPVNVPLLPRQSALKAVWLVWTQQKQVMRSLNLHSVRFRFNAISHRALHTVIKRVQPSRITHNLRRKSELMVSYENDMVKLIKDDNARAIVTVYTV